jgi:prolipoprotein diacylglyceryltransferase
VIAVNLTTLKANNKTGKRAMKKYLFYAVILGFLGTTLLSVASDKINTVNNRTNVVFEQIGE